MDALLDRDWPLDHVARLRLTRPDTRNAINRAVLTAFHDHLDALADRDVRALIVTGTEDTFSVGADLNEVQALDPAGARTFSRLGNELFARLEAFPCPVIAAVNGYALGGGCELACACDLRYAVASARLGQPETTLGMIPGWGGTFRLPDIVGRAAAKELVLTGEPVDAPEAREMGLVHRVFDAATFADDVLERARTVASNAPIATREAKRLLARSPDRSRSAVNEEALALAHCVSTDDQSEAVAAFLEKRTPTFRNQ